jgi:hypothetical protein
MVDEQWIRPAQTAPLCVAAARHAYPHVMDSGTHGFTLGALCGSHVLASLDGSDLDFVVNLGLVKGRLLEPGRTAPRCRPCRKPCSEGRAVSTG